MSSQQSPIGRLEDISLEFKSADALSQPSLIAKEAVGMLNERGGEIWIGIREDNGTATEIDPISDATDSAKSLRDSLIDLIEPSPMNSELIVTIVNEVMLKVAIQPQHNRKPYALLKGGGRHYLLRVADRNRPMTRQEIEQLFQDNPRDRERNFARNRLVQAKDQLIEQAAERFWLRFEPMSECDIDIQDPRLESYLRESDATGNREYGWNFVIPDKHPKVFKDGLGTGVEDYMDIRIYRSGGVEFEGSLEMLHWKGEQREIWALTLMEYCSSVARLVGQVYLNHTTLAEEDSVLVDIAFIDIGGWGLKPGSPRSLNYLIGELSYYSEMRDLVWNEPLSVTVGEVYEFPDYLTYRLLRRVFEAYGYREDAIPSEYNRDEKRIIWL